MSKGISTDMMTVDLPNVIGAGLHLPIHYVDACLSKVKHMYTSSITSIRVHQLSTFVHEAEH